MHLSALTRQGIVAVWSDRQIDAGQDWGPEIRRALDTADLILLLVSPDFLTSDFISEQELTRAMARHAAGEARVIPVFVRPCDWSGAPFGTLQGVPDPAKPISQWRNRDQAFTRVAQAIRKAAESLRPSAPPAPPTPPSWPEPDGRRPGPWGRLGMSFPSAMLISSWLILPLVGTFVTYILFASIFPNEPFTRKETMFVLAVWAAAVAVFWLGMRMVRILLRGRVRVPAGDQAPRPTGRRSR